MKVLNKALGKLRQYTPYLLYPILTVLQVVLIAIAWLLAPFLSLYSVIKSVDVLPGRWQWFSTVDDTLDGGIHQQEYPDYSRRNGFIIWWYRTRWIWRNPAQGFAYHLFRMPSATTEPHYVWRYGVYSFEYMNNTHYYTNPGESHSEYCTVTDLKGRQYFKLKGLKWFKCLKGKVGIRYYFGWKLTQKNGYRMLVVSLGLRFNLKSPA